MCCADDRVKLIVIRKKRDFNYTYHVVATDTATVEVFKKAFCSLFGLSSECVRRLCYCVKNNVQPTDRRGSGAARNAVSQSVLNIIEEHIKTFPIKMTVLLVYVSTICRTFTFKKFQIKKHFICGNSVSAFRVTDLQRNK